nr:protein FAM177A1 isoform X2 [Gorilla gorilla gorilla]
MTSQAVPGGDPRALDACLAGSDAPQGPAPPRPAQAGSCASQTAVGQLSGCGARRARRGAGWPRPSGRRVPFSEAWLGAARGGRCGASSPVVATTMDQEPVGRVERGEAVAASGAAAAAAFGESAGQMSNERGFENVELGVIGKKKKVPRRVIHFVSGETMEEYSTDEDEVDGLEKKDVLPTVDPTKLTWGPYLWFYMLRAATSTLSVCDFLGEKIASVLGISTPKYQYAIDEYYRMKKEEEEEEEENRMSEEAERQYQQNKLQTDSIVQTDQPETVISSSFVNVNFEMEGDTEVIMESKQNPVSVPP